MNCFLSKAFLLLCIAAAFASAQLQIEISEAERLWNSDDAGTVEKNDILQTCATEIHNARRNSSRDPILYHTQVEAAAKLHNDYMIENNCFSHQCPGEPGLGDRVSSTGYRWRAIGEILARGQGSCQDAINSWLNSAGHRGIMLGNYQHFGCSTGQRYWTCVFASTWS